MNYDIRLNLHYDYPAAAGGGRHQVRVVPRTIPGVQRVESANLSFSPRPAERSEFADFFGNLVTSFAYRGARDELDVTMSALVSVSRPDPALDVSPSLADLAAERAAVLSLAPEAPHHFLAASDLASPLPAITAFAREATRVDRSVLAIARELCRRIHEEFTYDGDATDATTDAAEAFRLKRGVCQDFSHVMIAGLRGLGIPAGYVSGFLRTLPPPGKARLEGADAMHAWVKVWCGREAGWQEFDPTNDLRANNDHIVVGSGRDYSDVTPIAGVFRTTGGQAGKQAVDVVPVD